MIKNRLIDFFKKHRGNALSVFYTAGYPTLDATVPIAIALEKAEVDIIEIGIPFSDPIADGPVIQQSNKIALQNGMTVRHLLKQVKVIRESVKIPIILMGYLNPVLQYGIERFVDDAANAGVDGLILPDMPLSLFEKEYAELFANHNLSSIFLVTPTTSDERIEKIDALSSGFVYAVSASSTTGPKKSFSELQLSYFERLQFMKLKNPVLIGFGISDHKTFSEASSFSAGAIVGSAFIEALGNMNKLDDGIHEFVKKMKGITK